MSGPPDPSAGKGTPASGRQTLDTAPAQVLDVTVLAGANADTRLRFVRGPVSFGRDGDQALVLDLPTVSRQHGTFDLKDGQWVVVNRSPNGLKLGRKTVSSKPASLPAHGTVSIGDAAVLQVELRRTGEAVPSLDLDAAIARKQAQPKDEDPLHRRNRMPTRTRILLGVVVFWVLLFALLLLFEPVLNPGDEQHDGRLALPVPRLTPAELDARLRADPPDAPTDDLRAERALAQAEQYYAMRDINSDAAWRAMDAYRNAANHLPGDRLSDPLQQRRYLDLQQRLSEEIAARYADALGKLDSRRFAAAAEALATIQQRFPDFAYGDDSLYRHTQRLREFARSRAETN
jgi:hypothetical protein